MVLPLRPPRSVRLSGDISETTAQVWRVLLTLPTARFLLEGQGVARTRGQRPGVEATPSTNAGLGNAPANENTILAPWKHLKRKIHAHVRPSCPLQIQPLKGLPTRPCGGGPPGLGSSRLLPGAPLLTAHAERT